MMGAGQQPVGGGGGAAAEREQKQLEMTTQNLGARIAEVRQSIHGLIFKLETDPRLNWPSFLDSYSLICGQLNTLLKIFSGQTAFKKHLCLPLILSQERDEDLLRLTEGRIPQFSHDIVPIYLRSLADPEVQAKYNMFESLRTTPVLAPHSPEKLQKQLNVLEKVSRECLKLVKREREDLDARVNLRHDLDKTCVMEETYNLVAAIANGKDLRERAQIPILLEPQPNMQPLAVGGSMGMGPGGPQGPGPTHKMPSVLKTNLKGARNPYNRQ